MICQNQSCVIDNCTTNSVEMNIFTIFAILTLKWPWYDLGAILMITDSLLEYLAQFWNTKTFYRHYNTQFSPLFSFASVYFEHSRSTAFRGHQRSNSVYLHILKWPGMKWNGYALQVLEMSCFYHKMHNRLPYLLYYAGGLSLKHCTFIQCWFNVGPASQTLA